MLRILAAASCLLTASATLFVQENEFRTARELNGLWSFVREQSNGGDAGMAAEWFRRDISRFPNATVMPVPSAYNDLSADPQLRDHIGWVWYQKELRVSEMERGRRLFLRFGSAQYYAQVYLNDVSIGHHVGGHLPFEFEVTDMVQLGGANRLTVAVNNTLSWATIPQGDFNYMKREMRNVSGRMESRYAEGYYKNLGNFDFFNYAGLLRPVYLVSRPASHVADIRMVAEHGGSFNYEVYVSAVNTSDESLVVRTRILSPDGDVAWQGEGRQVTGRVENVRAWWPRGMGSPDMYTMEVSLTVYGVPVDVYRLEFGFRSVSWDKDQIFINDMPFYCLGFGMHEDAEVRGRGYDAVTMTKDLNLLEWMGGNCYRTSHYPYAEERMRESDRRGIAVVVETPAVGLKGFPKANLLLHMRMLEDMIARDANHPSVFMWSIANEPQTQKKEARAYMKALVDHAHALDKTRPVTIVYGPTNFDNDQTADLVDIVGVNRYYGWYIDMGYLDTVNRSVVWDLSLWKATLDRPIFVMEYGADSIPGLNMEPSFDFSEQYQDDVIRETHKAFDALRRDRKICGEMIWNFADFMTAQDVKRAVGNHKGVFTRNRQAKIAAYTLRRRYMSLLDQSGYPKLFSPADGTERIPPSIQL